MNILIIDTSSNEEIRIGLKKADKTIWISLKVKQRSSQLILPLIEKLFKKNNLKLKDISAIEVKTGPGSFTGIRVGVAIANAFSYALGIPVNNKKIGDFASPEYQ